MLQWFKNSHFSIVLESEQGSAMLYGILAALSGWVFFEHGHRLLGEYDHPVIYWSVIAIISLISVFSIACAIHMKALGSKPVPQLRKDVQTEIEAYQEFISESMAMIEELTPIMAAHTGVVSRRAVDCLSTAKKIVAALERRVDETQELLQTKRKSDVIEAYDLLGRSLSITESRYDSLIDADPIPPLDPAEISATLSRLVQTIHAELKKVA